MFKKSKPLVAVLLVFVLCFTGVSTVFAAGDPIEGTETAPAQASITKLLQMPFGTAIPGATFSFQVRPIEVNETAYNDVTPNMPPIGNDGVISITYTGIETNMTSSAGVGTVSKESGNFLGNVAWTQPGHYVYEIEELDNTYNIVNAERERMDYSMAKYTLNIYVKESTTTPGTFYVFAIGAVIDEKDQNSLGEVGDKINPTPGSSNLVFTNTYVKTNGPTDPEKPDPVNESTLTIGKTVSGAYSSTLDYFDYSLTITTPAFVTKPAVYPAYIVEGTTIIGATDLEDSSKNNVTVAGTDSNGNAYIEVKPGTALPFRLKDGQKLVFINTSVGTRYNITEAAAYGYTASATVTTNGTAVTIAGPGTPNTALVITNQYIGETNNSVMFLNVRDDVTPGGVNLNNLPYIGLILLAFGAFVVFVAMKSRRRVSYNK